MLIMVRLRRLQLLVWCLLLPLLGTSLPRAAVWQCAHAAQVVTSFPPSASAMPCRMKHPTMACCRTASPVLPRGASFHAPPCKPTLTPAAPLPVARLAPASVLLADTDAAPTAFARVPPAVVFPPTLMAAAPRGPPPLPLAALARASAHGLRAPPVS